MRVSSNYDKTRFMHPILRYMERKEIETQREFAALVGLSPQYVNDVVNGRANLGRKGALKIERATSGLLTIQELLSWVPLPPSGAAEGAA